LLKQLDEKAFYALMLSAIGALYVGYTWTDKTSLTVNCIQTFLFGALAYLGIKKNMYFLAAGFVLHGAFDLVYSLFPLPDLRPPHYGPILLVNRLGSWRLPVHYRAQDQRNNRIIRRIVAYNTGRLIIPSCHFK
jgi:hypothetical protein